MIIIRYVFSKFPAANDHFRKPLSVDGHFLIMTGQFSQDIANPFILYRDTHFRVEFIWSLPCTINVRSPRFIFDSMNHIAFT